MKKILLPVFMLFAALTVYAQTQKAPPQYINYQAILRDKEGKILANKKVTVEFQILKYNGFSFDTERAETHTLNTTDLGLINLNIGKGSSMNGLPFKAISAINWADSLRLGVTVIDGQNGQRIIEPMSQSFASTPYTLLAQNSLKADTAKVALQSLGDTLWKKSGDTAIYTIKKYIGVGTDKPVSRLHIEGNLYQSTGNGFVWHKFSNQNRVKYFELSPNGDFYLYDKNSEFYNMIFRANGDANIGNAMTLVKSNGNIGIGTSDPQAKLDVKGSIRSTSLDVSTYIGCGSRIFVGASGTEDNYSLVHFKHGTAARGGIIRASQGEGDEGNAPIKYQGLSHRFEGLPNGQHGGVSVPFLEIRGGSDIVEKFKSKETLEAGILVTIDETDIHNYKTTSKAYQKGIVGIVSGANGVKHGMLLEQDDVLAGNTKVAIAGRVYVKATAQNGAIKAGDLLTSSDKEGYAMKSTNRRKAYGAVIGKALTSLNKGEGYVLVLVGLQ